MGGKGHSRMKATRRGSDAPDRDRLVEMWLRSHWNGTVSIGGEVFGGMSFDRLSSLGPGLMAMISGLNFDGLAEAGRTGAPVCVDGVQIGVFSWMWSDCVEISVWIDGETSEMIADQAWMEVCVGAIAEE